VCLPNSLTRRFPLVMPAKLVPAKAGSGYPGLAFVDLAFWIPAFAGMTRGLDRRRRGGRLPDRHRVSRLMPPRTNRASLDTCLVVLLLAGAAAAVAGCLCAVGNTEITVWGDRDLWRALEAFRHWPVLGPETNGGARTPGGAFYLLLAGFLAIHPGVVAANLGVVIFFAASALLLWMAFAREVSPLAGALVAAAFAGSGLLADDLGVWNPGYLDLFGVVATVAGYHFIRCGRAAALGVATTALALGMQVHMQIAELALGLAIAVAIFRPRLHWRHAAAFALGLLVPYLPALLSNGPGMVLAAAAVPGDAVTAYVFLDIKPLQKAALLYDLLGGSSDSFAQAAAGRLPWAAHLLAAADLLTAALALVFLLRLLPGRLRSARPAAFAVFAVITLAYLAVTLVSFVNARHMVAVVPAVAAMIGLAAEEIVVRLRRAGLPGTVAACAICALIAARPALLGASQLFDHDFSASSTQAQEEIAAVLKAGFYPDRESFENHAALFWRGLDGGWQMAQGRLNNRMAFIYRTAAVSSVATGREDCVAIVTKADIAGDPREELAASPALADFAPVFAAAAESTHFVYLPYTARDGNCLKTFPNAYIPTEFETAHLPPEAGAAATANDGGAVFIAPQPGHRFPLGVELRRQGGGYVAVLQGRLLRGYTGLYFRTIVAPKLCLVAHGGLTVVSFGKVTVGSPQQGTLAPWRSPRFDLADGSYELWLTGRDGRQPLDIDLHLGRLTVPDLAAAPPLEGATVPAPAGCAEARPLARKTVP